VITILHRLSLKATWLLITVLSIAIADKNSSS